MLSQNYNKKLHTYLKNRLRGSKPLAFAWTTSLLLHNGTSEWKYLPEKYKVNVILAKGEYHCGIEEKTRCNSTVTKGKEIFIAAEICTVTKIKIQRLRSVSLLH